MTSLSSSPVSLPEKMNAVEYRRAHSGKLMRITREEGRGQDLADFFHFDSVGTHPTGLFVTGIFANGQRRHMNVSLVRDASEAEIAWRNTYQQS